MKFEEIIVITWLWKSNGVGAFANNKDLNVKNFRFQFKNDFQVKAVIKWLIWALIYNIKNDTLKLGTFIGKRRNLINYHESVLGGKRDSFSIREFRFFSEIFFAAVSL